MKKLIKSFPLLLCFIISSCAQLPPATRSPQSAIYDEQATIQGALDYLKQQQIDEEYWSGGYTTDVTSEAMFLGLGTRLGLLTEEEKEKWVEVIFKRMHTSALGWEAYPGGPVDLNVTGYTLKVLDLLGTKKSDEKVLRAWEFYQKNGGDKKLNIVAKVQLGALDLLDGAQPPLPIQILGVPKMLPVSTTKLGIHGQLFVSMLGFSFFKSLPENALAPLSKNLRNYKEMPLHIGQFHIFKENENLRSLLNPQLVSEKIPTSSIEWAIETLAFVLQKQNQEKGWYGTWFTTFNLMLLSEAQRVGLGDFRPQINSAWASMHEWQSKSAEGFAIQQSMRSSIWDTSYSLMALKMLPENNGPIDISRIESWLLKNRLRISEKNQMTSSWSFDHTDISAPDVDDTAAVVHALALGNEKKTSEVQEAIQEGLRWVLARQNFDGGFPAWSKGVQAFPFIALKILMPNTPEFEDVSQADVTARVLAMLNDVEELKLNSSDLIQVRFKACRFLETKAEYVSKIPTKVFVGHWVTNYAYGASMLIHGLAQGKCGDDQWIDELSKWLVGLQQESGGWGEDNDSYLQKTYVKGNPTLIQSLFVLNSLMEAFVYFKEREGKERTDLKVAIENGIRFLENKTEQGTNFFEKNFSAVTIKGMAYSRYELLPAYMSLATLERWRKIKETLK